MIKEIEEFTLYDDLSLVTIYTANCGTCKVALRMIEIVSESFKDANFYRYNATNDKELLIDLKIKSIPALIFTKDNKVEEVVYGFNSVTNIFNILSKYK